MKRLEEFKNNAWAIAIAMCLLALVVGLIFSMTKGYYGPSATSQIQIGSDRPIGGGDSKADGGDSYVDGGDVVDGGGSGEAGEGDFTYALGGGELTAVPETEDAGQTYINRITFLCDSVLIGLRDNGVLPGGKDTMQVWGTQAGNLPFATINESTIIYPADGSEQTVETAMSLARPEILCISVGTDGLSGMAQADFLATYRTLIQSIWAASPETIVICCGNCSVIPNYTGSDALTPTMMSDANDWIQEICKETGAFYADIGYVLGDGAGNMFPANASSNGKALNTTGLNLVLDYLKTHAVA